MEEDVNIATSIVPNLASDEEFHVFTSNVFFVEVGRDSKVVRVFLRGPPFVIL